MMTRKDYVAIAAALRRATEITDDQGFDDRTFPSCIADALERGNPNFKRARFMDAARS